MVQLREITKDNLEDVLSLQVSEKQKEFVSSTAHSLAQAYVYKGKAFPFAIYADDALVGFIMMGYYEERKQYTLWKFLIDKSHQNKGYGRAALVQGIAYLRDEFGVNEVYTGVLPGNEVAKRLYVSVGFAQTGLVEYGMEEMKYQAEE